MFHKALFVVASTVLMSVYRQSVQCSASNISHIKLWNTMKNSALDIKINYTLKATAKRHTYKK